MHNSSLNLVIVNQFEIVVCRSNMASSPTLSQIEALVEFLELNPRIAKGFLRTNQDEMETKRKWKSLATTLNSLGGANKDGQGWTEYWVEKKCSLEKLCAQQRESMRRTDGGPANSLPLSALDTRLVAVMGGQEFDVEDPQLTVDPFPQRSQQSQMTSPPYLAPLVEDMESVMEHEEVIVSGTSPGAEIQTPPRRTRSQPKPRRRSITRKNDEFMDRLAQIEEQRVNAETLNARAMANVATALENIAISLTAVASALERIYATR